MIVFPIMDWKIRRSLAPAIVQVSVSVHGLRDWEVLLAKRGKLNFGMALIDIKIPDSVLHPSPEHRVKENPYSERNYADAMRFAKWINSPPGWIERFVSWCFRRIIKTKTKRRKKND
jgi:hypothetical protein